MQAKWTDAILDEVFRSLRRDRTDLDPQKLDRTRALMAGAIRDVLVVGYEPLIEAVALPDPDDRHVLAAAIKARAQLIVTHKPQGLPRRSARAVEHPGRQPGRLRQRPDRPRSGSRLRRRHPDRGLPVESSEQCP